MPLESPGKIITFYSYKGGTGRTMALANVACLLAQRADPSDRRGVLMIDWDLEAPGLHRFFRDRLSRLAPPRARDIDARLDEAEGLLDFFWRLRERTADYTEKNPQRAQEAHELLEEVPPESYAVRTDIGTSDGGGLWLLKAGSDKDYSDRVNTFGWEAFYKRAPWLIRAFAERLGQLYRYVLIDSRTGLTDVSGICTMMLPEKLVFVFTLNRQSILGGRRVIANATAYRSNSSDLRPLVVYPLPSRVDPGRDDLRKFWREGNPDWGLEGYEPQFERLLKEIYGLKECKLGEYFKEVQIQHSSTYAYGEEIAALVETNTKEDRLTLQRSFMTFTDRLVNTSSPWQGKAVARLARPDPAVRTEVFPNGKSARVITPGHNMTPREMLDYLQLGGNSALFVLVGGGGDSADPQTLARLSPLLGGVMTRVAADMGAALVGDGTPAGISGVVGKGAADRARAPALVGVAPQRVAMPDGEARAALEPNHTVFVLAQGDTWGDEVETKYELAHEVGKSVPVVAFLAGGGPGARKELLRVVEHKWPLVVVEGAGALSDALAALHRDPKAAPPFPTFDVPPAGGTQGALPAEAFIDSSTLREVAGQGDIKILPRNGSDVEFERLIYRSLPGGQVLEEAWKQYSAYTRRAHIKWRLASLLEYGFLSSGCLAVFFALLPVAREALGYGDKFVLRQGPLKVDDILEMLRFRTFDLWSGVCAAAMYLLFVYYNGRRPIIAAERWRDAAETVKSEIFKYRARVGKYATAQPFSNTAVTRLRDSITAIVPDLPDPKANWPKSGADIDAYVDIGSNDGFSLLPPERYAAMRLRDQIAYNNARRASLKRRGLLLRLLVLVLSALGVLFTIFIKWGGGTFGAMSITLAIAVLALIGIRRGDQKMQLYAIVTHGLVEVQQWWDKLTDSERADQKNIDRLVVETEEAIGTERRGYEVSTKSQWGQ